jgi:hypothetical protein
VLFGEKRRWRPSARRVILSRRIDVGAHVGVEQEPKVIE